MPGINHPDGTAHKASRRDAISLCEISEVFYNRCVTISPGETCWVENKASRSDAISLRETGEVFYNRRVTISRREILWVEKRCDTNTRPIGTFCAGYPFKWCEKSRDINNQPAGFSCTSRARYGRLYGMAFQCFSISGSGQL